MRLVGLSLLISLALSWIAQAAIIRVPSDYPTIQGAVDAAAPGDTVEVACGTYVENIEIRHGVTLRSESGLPDCVTLEGGAPGSSVLCPVIDGFEIEGITLRGGLSDGGIFAYDSVIALRQCVFIDFALSAVEAYRTTATIGECMFSNCRRSAVRLESGAHHRIEECHFFDNFSPTSSGALEMSDANEFLVRACEFRSNVAGLWGGAGRIQGDGRIDGCRFIDNEAGERGGGLQLGSPSPCSEAPCLWIEVVETLFEGNRAHFGGAIFIHTVRGTITSSTFAGNTAAGAGGAVTCYQSAAEFERSTFFGNAAPIGSAFVSQNQHLVRFENSILAFNAEGAAVARFSPPVPPPTFICTDIYGNGGGDWVDWIEGLDTANGNFSADPLFCDANLASFTIHSDSPCAPPGIDGCGLVGAWPVGCGSIPVERATWAQIKSKYR